MKKAKKKGAGIMIVKLIIAAIFVVYAVGGIFNIWGQITQKRAETEALQAQVAAQRLRNIALEEDIESDDIEGRISRAARDRLGLVEPGEIIIVDMTP